MTILADDPTAAAVLAHVPCYAVPPQGRSPALDQLRAARVGHGLAIGNDGVSLIVRRPWLALDLPISPPLSAYVPYGSTGGLKADLRCGRIPRSILDHVLDHFRAALPNEAAAFVIWDETAASFHLHLPEIDEATPSRLVYRTPALAPASHLICDIHSHGSGPAFFSATDDADDARATKIAMVVGRVDHPDGPTIVSRLCADGMFVPFPRSPFSGDHDAS